MKYFFLFIHLTFFNYIYCQSDASYIKKADNFIKDYLSKLNNIHDTSLADQQLRLISSNQILNEIVRSRDSTILYDNVSQSFIKNNYLNSQRYIDRYVTLLESIMNSMNSKYNVINKLGEFRKDTVYNDAYNNDKICKTTREVTIQFINKKNNKIHRTDTISYYVSFTNKDLNYRYIIHSERYKSAINDLIKDTDGDDIPDYRDSCILIKGVDYCNGCPDSDLDGVCNKLDNCPDQKGETYCNGCPDTDGDAVCDLMDNCPLEAGSKENLGCPQIKEKEKLISIPKKSFPVLEIPIELELSKFLNNRPYTYYDTLNLKYREDLSVFNLRDLDNSDQLIVNFIITPDRISKQINIESELKGVLLNGKEYIQVQDHTIATKANANWKLMTLYYKLNLNALPQLTTVLKKDKK